MYTIGSLGEVLMIIMVNSDSLQKSPCWDYRLLGGKIVWTKVCVAWAFCLLAFLILGSEQYTPGTLWNKSGHCQLLYLKERKAKDFRTLTKFLLWGTSKLIEVQVLCLLKLEILVYYYYYQYTSMYYTSQQQHIPNSQSQGCLQCKKNAWRHCTHFSVWAPNSRSEFYAKRLKKFFEASQQKTAI